MRRLRAPHGPLSERNPPVCNRVHDGQPVHRIVSPDNRRSGTSDTSIRRIISIINLLRSTFLSPSFLFRLRALVSSATLIVPKHIQQKPRIRHRAFLPYHALGVKHVNVAVETGRDEGTHRYSVVLRRRYGDRAVAWVGDMVCREEPVRFGARPGSGDAKARKLQEAPVGVGVGDGVRQGAEEGGPGEAFDDDRVVEGEDVWRW